MPTSRLVYPLLTAALFVFALEGSADDTTAPIYRTPPEPLTAIIDAPATPMAALDPHRRFLALFERSNLPSITELSRPELRLAGLRIDPAVDGPSRSRPHEGLRLIELEEGAERAISGLPPEPRLSNFAFSPDGSRLAFVHATDEELQLWVLEVASGEARRLSEARLSLVMRNGPSWLGDDTLAVALVPGGRGLEPRSETVPNGPTIQESLGRKAPARTYQDLLQNPYDEALFEYYATAQLALVGLDGELTPLGEPAIVQDFEPSPDGRYLLVEILERPFSYLVPAGRFPERVEIWNDQGETVHTVARLPLREEVPIGFGSVPTGVRQPGWRSDAPATVVWVEALDGGDANRETDERDRLFQLEAPFDGEPRSLATFGLRYGGTQWGSDDLAVAFAWWWKTRQVRVWALEPGDVEAEPRVLMEYSLEDRYNDPGQPLTETNAYGQSVLRVQGGDLFLVGEGASPEGNRPFLDRYDLETGEKKRLFRSEAPNYERPVDLIDEAGRYLLTRRESRDEPPNYFVRDLETGELRRLTSFPHPTPQLAGIQKELIRYQRGDGIELTGTLYLPAGYDPEKDGPLPALIWAYPQEFKSADAAGQVTDSPYRFDRTSWASSLLWVTQGYAVLDDPSMPIIGEGEEEPNDTYVEQLVAGARAAVDELVRRGVAEKGRIAIGGHSYGAFTTANLLAHSDLFAAGIARSGAYNRSLTPFGFQAEERTFWQAPEVYFAMSPFMHAEKVDEPLLMIHGEADNNSGTFPMQSERFYDALQGLGATVRLVMLPHESHGYRARESVLHMLWETDRWLETWVLDKAPEGEAEEENLEFGGSGPLSPRQECSRPECGILE